MPAQNVNGSLYSNDIMHANTNYDACGKQRKSAAISILKQVNDVNSVNAKQKCG